MCTILLKDLRALCLAQLVQEIGRIKSLWLFSNVNTIRFAISKSIYRKLHNKRIQTKLFIEFFIRLHNHLKPFQGNRNFLLRQTVKVRPSSFPDTPLKVL